jgi:hypothetical protein
MQRPHAASKKTETLLGKKKNTATLSFAITFSPTPRFTRFLVNSRATTSQRTD